MDPLKMQMVLECVAQDEPEGKEIIWSEDEKKGDLITTFNCLFRVQKRQSQACQRHIVRISVRNPKIPIRYLTGKGFASWVVCFINHQGVQMLEKVTRKTVGSPSSKILKTQLDKVQDPDLIASATEQKTHHLRTSLPTSSLHNFNVMLLQDTVSMLSTCSLAAQQSSIGSTRNENSFEQTSSCSHQLLLLFLPAATVTKSHQSTL